MAKPNYGIKEIADTTGRQLARVVGVECRHWRPLESTLPATTELLAGRVFLVQNGRERFVVYFEFYTQWDRNARWDMLAKSSLLWKRVHLRTVSIVVSDAFRYRLYAVQQDHQFVDYANLIQLQRSALDLVDRLMRR